MALSLAALLFLSLALAPSSMAQLPEEPEVLEGEEIGVECVAAGGFPYVHGVMQLGYCEYRLCWLVDGHGDPWPLRTLRWTVPDWVCAPLAPAPRPGTPDSESGAGGSPAGAH